jgi:hypothetical protein
MKLDGTPCRALTLPGKTACAFHDPALVEQRAAGRRLGGKVRSRPAAVLPANTPDAPLATVQDVAAFLGQVINLVRTGRIAVSVANSIGLLCGQLLRALEGGELEKRIAALEARVEEGSFR